MKKWGMRLAMFAVVIGTSGGCDTLMPMVDPTYGMSPEEKQAYQAKKEAERKAREEERKRKEAAFRARSPNNMTAAGEGHSESRDSAIVGRWGYNRTATNWVSIVLFDEKEGKREWAEDLVLFENGSFARKLVKDDRSGKDSKGKDWSMQGSGDLFAALNNQGGLKPGEIVRGQWKTAPYTATNPETGEVIQTQAIYLRNDSMSGYGGWQYLGAYELLDNGRSLIVLNEKQLMKDQQRIENGKKNEYTVNWALQAVTNNTLQFKRR